MKVSKSFQAVRPGDVYPSTIEEGEVVKGRLLEIATELGCVERAAPQKTEAEIAAETQAKKDAAAAKRREMLAAKKAAAKAASGEAKKG